MSSVSGEKVEWELVDTKNESADPTPKKISLHTPSQVRREMAAVYRDMRNGTIEATEGTKLIYALDRIREALKEEVIDGRLAVVEQVLKLRKES